MLKNNIEENIKNKIENNINDNDNIEDNIKNKIKDNIGNNIENKIENKIENNINENDNIEDNIENKIKDNIGNNIENNIENNINDNNNIEDNIKNNIEISEEKKIPKKRGRKPKIKDVSILKEVKIPKKRGRKPKIKIITEDEKNKFILPSKRGRKPKDKTLLINKISNINNITNTILHLPIPTSILENIDNDNMNIINPYDPDMLENNINNINNDIKNSNILNNEKNCKYGNFESFFQEEQLDSNNDYYNSDLYNNNYINSNIYNNNLMINKELNNMNNINYIKKYSNIEQSYVKCNWCLHDCEKNNIFKLPYEINNEEIKYFGNFCCPECAVAFNFSELDDEYVWERYSLLNYLYNKDNNKLNIAPSRLVLDIFGGPISINEYKNIILNKKYINIITPPHLIICPQLEIKKNKENSLFIPLNINRINKYTDDLKLKRKKPINNINTLEDCMNLKCINKNI